MERLILAEAPDKEAVEMDVVFVGGGPAGLAGAIELKARGAFHPDDRVVIFNTGAGWLYRA